MIKFSVLISIYYYEKAEYLNLCLSSLYNQAIYADEIVLVCDGPISEALECEIQQWKEVLPLKVIRLLDNVGLGRALNEGITQCSNEWIFRMDADDICEDSRFEKQIQYIMDNPDVVLLGGQIQEFDENMNNILGNRTVPSTNQDIRNFALSRNPFNHMTVAYRKSVVLEVGGYQHHLYMEDYNLWLRIIEKGYEVHNLVDVLVKARTGNAMYERRKGIEYIRSEFKIAQLKASLNLQNTIMAYVFFIMRAISRILPTKLLGVVYRYLRRN